ncbi:hypothetical protein PVAP13_8KG319100 [Panicum virgatum]|uniref:DUF1618 domain-containing protein n=2 Tax=Panicum virgatum TaxID=38727 RepID=A0A8T0PPE3_PANVG|nr:hypothetical protein PVAP13_8KG319100 [Panicum virgatum]
MGGDITRFRLQDATLHPPALSPDDGCAYVAERRNATTAFSETWSGHRIQVTLFLARPPRVSYLCVFCPDLDHAVFPLEPKILATEDDLVLLRIIRLPRLPSPYGPDSHRVGILRCGTSVQQRPHRGTAGDFYVVAGLCRAPNAVNPGEFVLCLHNSSFSIAWSTHNISLDEQQRRQYGSSFHHVNNKVIAIGGEAGTMGLPTPPLRYVRLPSPLGKTWKAWGLRWKLCLTFRGHYVNDGWMSRTWSRPDLSCKRESSGPMPPEVLGDGGMPLGLFKGLEMCQPIISLHDDDDGTVYFMVKKNRMDNKAWVIAVDMQNNTLQGVAEFAAGRTFGMSITFMHSMISRHLTTAPEAKGNLKRPGTVLLGSSNKMPRGFWMSMPPRDDDQEQHDAETQGNEDMILDGG